MEGWREGEGWREREGVRYVLDRVVAVRGSEREGEWERVRERERERERDGQRRVLEGEKERE